MMTNRQKRFKTVIRGFDSARAGETALLIKETLRKMAVQGALARRVSIAAWEMEMNIAVHAYEGTLEAVIKPGYVEIVAEDKGPGIPDLELAMCEGYSTVSEELRRQGFGAGMGLPNIRNNSDIFEIESVSNRGTKVRIKTFLPPH